MSTPNLLLSALLAPAEFTVNQLLKQDALLSEKLGRHTGDVLKIHITRPDISVYLFIEPAQIRLAQDYPEHPTASISGDIPALVNLLLSDSADLHDAGIEVDGDMQKAREIQKLLSASSIDWAYHFSRLFGDIPAQSAETAFSSAREYGSKAADNLRRDMDEYLHEESGLLPGRNELDIFYSQIDELRMRTDRLQARVNILVSKDNDD